MIGISNWAKTTVHISRCESTSAPALRPVWWHQAPERFRVVPWSASTDDPFPVNQDGSFLSSPFACVCIGRAGSGRLLLGKPMML